MISAVVLDCATVGPIVQVFILDALVNYQVQDSKDAEKIVERVLPRLQHVNSAVVLSAAKVGSRLCCNIQGLGERWYRFVVVGLPVVTVPVRARVLWEAT